VAPQQKSFALHLRLLMILQAINPLDISAVVRVFHRASQKVMLPNGINHLPMGLEDDVLFQIRTQYMSFLGSNVTPKQQINIQTHFQPGRYHHL